MAGTAVAGMNAPLTEIAMKNMEMWEQMRTATRNAFGAKPTAAEPAQPAQPETGKSAKPGRNRKKDK